MADADYPGEASAAAAELVAAGRANQSSRLGGAQLAGGLPERLFLCLRTHLSRPLFSGCDGQKDRGNLEQADSLLCGQLCQIRRPEDAAPRPIGCGLSESTRAYRATRSVYQPLSVPGHQGQAGTEPDQGTGKDGADRIAAGREDDPFLFPPTQAEWANRRGS